MSNSGVDPLAALLAGSADGDEAAFADLYRQTSPTVYSMAFRMLCSRAHAEEVTQEVYVQVWQQAGRYDRSKGTVLGWMKMLAHRRAVDRVRAVNSASSGTAALRNSPQSIGQVMTGTMWRPGSMRRGCITP